MKIKSDKKLNEKKYLEIKLKKQNKQQSKDKDQNWIKKLNKIKY